MQTYQNYLPDLVICTMIWTSDLEGRHAYILFTMAEKVLANNYWSHMKVCVCGFFALYRTLLN